VAVKAKPEVEIWQQPKNRLLTLVSYSLLAAIQNVTDDRRQTTHCIKGATDSAVGQRDGGHQIYAGALS